MSSPWAVSLRRFLLVVEELAQLAQRIVCVARCREAISTCQLPASVGYPLAPIGASVMGAKKRPQLADIRGASDHIPV